jgi:hypothetical protein
VTALGTFVTARLDEAEQHAVKDIWLTELVTPGEWVPQYGINLQRSYLKADGEEIARFTSHRDSPPLADGEDDLHACDAALAARMANAARPRAELALRQITALRAICALYEESTEHRYDLPAGVHDGRDDDERLRDEAVWLAVEDIMMHVASVWAGHPDFDRAWLQA